MQVFEAIRDECEEKREDGGTWQQWRRRSEKRAMLVEERRRVEPGGKKLRLRGGKGCRRSSNWVVCF
ncbi:hypothetical protein C2W62_01230 [Candidatus Entotheonella serta]|nr:hypothetical protein C2W62_01230 [Candidatus Entotheonella serta]